MHHLKNVYTCQNSDTLVMDPSYGNNQIDLGLKMFTVELFLVELLQYSLQEIIAVTMITATYLLSDLCANICTCYPHRIAAVSWNPFS